jgi:hypothetical protein
MHYQQLPVPVLVSSGLLCSWKCQCDVISVMAEFMVSGGMLQGNVSNK